MWCSWKQMLGANMMLKRESDSHLLTLFLKSQKNINKYRSLSCLGILQIIQQAWFNFLFHKVTHYTNLQKQLFKVIVTSSKMITSAKLHGKNNSFSWPTNPTHLHNKWNQLLHHNLLDNGESQLLNSLRRRFNELSFCMKHYTH